MKGEISWYVQPSATRARRNYFPFVYKITIDFIGLNPIYNSNGDRSWGTSVKIQTKPNTTVGKYTVCSKDDIYDLKEGARIAFKRALSEAGLSKADERLLWKTFYDVIGQLEIDPEPIVLINKMKGGELYPAWDKK